MGISVIFMAQSCIKMTVISSLKEWVKCLLGVPGVGIEALMHTRTHMAAESHKAGINPAQVKCWDSTCSQSLLAGAASQCVWLIFLLEANTNYSCSGSGSSVCFDFLGEKSPTGIYVIQHFKYRRHKDHIVVFFKSCYMYSFVNFNFLTLKIGVWQNNLYLSFSICWWRSQDSGDLGLNVLDVYCSETDWSSTIAKLN